MTMGLQSDVPREVRAGKFVLLAIIATAATIATSLVVAGPSAHAESGGGNGNVTAGEISAAIENVDGGLVRDAAGTTSLPSSSLATPQGSEGSESLDVVLPTNAVDGVSLSVGDFALGISLPHADGADRSQALADGSIAYPSDGASANVVVPTSGGVQLLSVIEAPEASEAYPYELSLPAGHRLEATSDGGARIVDEGGIEKVLFEPAWAKDAAGRSVPTHYEVAGNTLTQVVQHRDLEGVSYPVVADPLPVVVIVITAAAMIVVAALALGVATWIVVSWWNTCRAQNKWPELSTRNGFTARCVR